MAAQNGLPLTTLTPKHTSGRLSFSFRSTSALPFQCSSRGKDKPDSPYLSCADTDYSAPPAPCSLSCTPLQPLHTSWVINARDVLVLKACKTKHSVSVGRTRSLFPIEMGHLERNPIKNIPLKLWLFFPLLGLITELLLVSRCPILLRWSSVSVSHHITFINCSRTLRHTEKKSLFRNIWISEQSVVSRIGSLSLHSAFTGQVQYVVTFPSYNLESTEVVYPVIQTCWVVLRLYFYSPVGKRVNRTESRKEWTIYFNICVLHALGLPQVLWIALHTSYSARVAGSARGNWAAQTDAS